MHANNQSAADSITGGREQDSADRTQTRQGEGQTQERD